MSLSSSEYYSTTWVEIEKNALHAVPCLLRPMKEDLECTVQFWRVKSSGGWEKHSVSEVERPAASFPYHRLIGHFKQRTHTGMERRVRLPALFRSHCKALELLCWRVWAWLDNPWRHCGALCRGAGWRMPPAEINRTGCLRVTYLESVNMIVFSPKGNV